MKHAILMLLLLSPAVLAAHYDETPWQGEEGGYIIEVEGDCLRVNDTVTLRLIAPAAATFYHQNPTGTSAIQAVAAGESTRQVQLTQTGDWVFHLDGDTVPYGTAHVVVPATRSGFCQSISPDGSVRVLSGLADGCTPSGWPFLPYYSDPSGIQGLWISPTGHYYYRIQPQLAAGNWSVIVYDGVHGKPGFAAVATWGHVSATCTGTEARGFTTRLGRLSCPSSAQVLLDAPISTTNNEGSYAGIRVEGSGQSGDPHRFIASVRNISPTGFRDFDLRLEGSTYYRLRVHGDGPGVTVEREQGILLNPGNYSIVLVQVSPTGHASSAIHRFNITAGAGDCPTNELPPTGGGSAKASCTTLGDLVPCNPFLLSGLGVAGLAAVALLVGRRRLASRLLLRAGLVAAGAVALLLVASYALGEPVIRGGWP